MSSYGLDNPAPGHVPTVQRIRTGKDRGATSLSCSCGRALATRVVRAVLPDGSIEESHFPLRSVKVSSMPPSRGGRVAAAACYLDHLEQGRQAA